MAREVCTARRARLRIRAIVVTDFGPERSRLVRRQGAGCTRHRLRARGENLFEEEAVSMLRVAWRRERRHTRWLSAGDPAPDKDSKRRPCRGGRDTGGLRAAPAELAPGRRGVRAWG